MLKITICGKEGIKPNNGLLVRSYFRKCVHMAAVCTSNHFRKNVHVDFLLADKFRTLFKDHELVTFYSHFFIIFILFFLLFNNCR